MSRRSRHFNHIQRWVPPQQAKEHERGAHEFKLAVIIHHVSLVQNEHMELMVLSGLFNNTTIAPLLYQGLLVQAIRAFHAVHEVGKRNFEFRPRGRLKCSSEFAPECVHAIGQRRRFACFTGMPMYISSIKV